MSERKWTPEPWKTVVPEGSETNPDLACWLDFVQGGTLYEADALRAEACVNALAAVGNPEGLLEFIKAVDALMACENNALDDPNASEYFKGLVNRVLEAQHALQIDEENLP